jgi:hypothetical protein
LNAGLTKPLMLVAMMRYLAQRHTEMQAYQFEKWPGFGLGCLNMDYFQYKYYPEYGLAFLNINQRFNLQKTHPIPLPASPMKGRSLVPSPLI